MRQEDCLQQGWRDIRPDAAAGVEQVRAQAYEPPLDANLHHLGERLQQQRDRAKLVRRPSIPPGDGPRRQIGQEQPRVLVAGLPACPQRTVELPVAALQGAARPLPGRARLGPHAVCSAPPRPWP